MLAMLLVERAEQLGDGRAVDFDGIKVIGEGTQRRGDGDGDGHKGKGRFSGGETDPGISKASSVVVDWIFTDHERRSRTR